VYQRQSKEKHNNEEMKQHWELIASIVGLARKGNHVVGDFNKGDE
jgi:hypothetical protein